MLLKNNILFLILLILPKLTFAWEENIFTEDNNKQYWVGFSDFHDKESVAYNQAYEMATTELSKYNFGFFREEIETSSHNLKSKKLFQESVSKGKNTILKGLVVEKKKTIKKNNKYKIFLKLSYKKSELNKEIARLNEDQNINLIQKSFYDKKNYNFIINSNIEEGQITLINTNNGERLTSTTGNPINFPSGKYLIILSKKGYKEIKKNIILSPSNMKLYIPMEKEYINYQINVIPKDAIVKINNKTINPENINLELFPNIELDDPIYLNVNKEGFLSKTEQTTLRYIKNNILKVKLIPTSKSISFITTPEQAKVYIDGEFIGETPLIGLNTHKENFSISIIKKDYKMINSYIKNNKKNIFNYNLELK